ncbi:MAG: type II toxin-antitoxin system VapC family toxin [Gammaproteobacteria bacterium]|nr:type II toxin-antitoxin system VapC family toxin [Gammaproteobacteria bacterium]
MVLLDSNIFIYAIQPQFESLRQWCLQQSLHASNISRLEVLGYYKLNQADKRDLTRLFEMTTLYPVTNAIVECAIELRQQRKMSLGDAVIAATALEYQQTLVTRNLEDFVLVEGLEVVNPMEVEQ